MALDTKRLAEEESRVLALTVDAIERHCSALGKDIGQSEAKDLASAIMQHFVRATAPDRPALDTTLRLFVMDVGPTGPDFESAERVNPGHIRLNFSRFATAVSSGVLSAVGVAQAPWTLPFAALVIWNTLWSSLKVQVTEREAVIWTMWTRRDKADEVADSGFLDSVNFELKSHGRIPMQQSALTESLSVLERMGCIERSSRDSEKWWLREWVSVRFT